MDLNDRLADNVGNTQPGPAPQCAPAGRKILIYHCHGPGSGHARSRASPRRNPKCTAAPFPTESALLIDPPRFVNPPLSAAGKRLARAAAIDVRKEVRWKLIRYYRNFELASR